MDLFEFAMKMELDGKEYYEKLAAETGNRALRTLFTQLAADEQKHYDTIVGIRESTAGVMADTTVLGDAKNVFEEQRADQVFVDSLKKGFEGCLHAMKIEEESVRLYEEIAEKEENPDIVQLVLKIANEEKKHYTIMENLYMFGMKPEYYLEWREFGNLDRL